MKASKYIIAGEPINWVESLNQYYAEDEKKRRRYGEQLRQRNQEAVQIAKEESPIKVLEKLSGLSKTVSTLVRQQKAAEKAKDDVYKLKAQQIWSGLDPTQKELILNAQRESIKDLQFDAALFENKLKKAVGKDGQPLIPVDVQKAFVSGLGGNHLHLNQQMGYHVSLYGLDAAIEAKPNKWKIDLDVIKNKGDARGVTDKYKTVAYEELKKLGFNEEFIAANFEKPLEKFVNTKENIGKLYYQDIWKTEREIKLANKIPTAQTQFHDNDDPAALTNLMHQQKLSIADTDRFVAMQARLSKKGEGFTYTEIQAARQHELDKRGKFPAGDKGEDLLSDEQWDIWEQAALSHSTQVFNAKQTQLQNNLVAGMADLDKLAQTATIEELVAEQNRLGVEFISGGGSENNDAYKSLMGMDVTKQSPGAYARTKEEYSWAYSDENVGRLLESEALIADGIPNQAVAGELGVRLKEVKKTLKAAGLPTKFDDLQKWSKDQIIKSGGQQINISERDTVFSDRNKRFQRSITIRRINKIVEYSNSPDYQGKPLAAEFAATNALKTELANEGFHVKNIRGNKGIGPASPDVDGQYRGFEQIRTAQEENNRVLSETNKITWHGNIKTEMLEAGGDINTVLSHDRAISKTDTLGAFVEDSNPTDGFQYQTKIYYSPELIYKALLMKTQPGNVLRIRLKNIIADPDNKDFVRNHGLEEKLKLLENAPDLVLERFVQSTGDQKLTTKYNQGGVLMFSQADLEKLIDLEKLQQVTN